ncbi:hypothetical protein KUV62_15740 [Salipiger bermudensis]|uniref:hypothetical protein n=1 Tax=Salipiger bermudensis TaxID=344736 RepID=UPI001C99F9C6|nr:hypothetical protein [Salipiger bermudensis]MBY6005377.1 hypothetical protein [Salipiger bermudensis]
MSFNPFARQSKPGSRSYSGERVVNYFARPSEGVSQIVLVGTGGLSEFADTGTGDPVRSMIQMGGNMFVASGGIVWKITAAGVVSNVGTITDGETYMAANRTQVAIVVGGVYYVCNGLTTASYSTGAVDTPVGVTSADGYMIVIGTGAGVDDLIQLSALDDATTFDAADFVAAEYNADPLLAAYFDHGEVYFLGSETVERFYNSGATDFPFTRNQGAIIEIGTISGKTVAEADNSLFWVTPDKKVARVLGADPQWISTPEIKDELERSTVTGGFTFSDQGHEFYAITREGGTTLVFDLVTGLWHERSSGLSYGPWLAEAALLFQGEQYFGCSNGKIATVSESDFSDFGETMQAEAVAPLVARGGRYFRVTRFYLDVEGGTGGLGRAPEVMLQTSRDGYSWGPEMWREMGGLGQYAKRAQWNALGLFEVGKARLRITDNVPRNIVGVAVDYG